MSQVKGYDLQDMIINMSVLHVRKSMQRIYQQKIISDALNLVLFWDVDLWTLQHHLLRGTFLQLLVN
jgi:hypothetical protein